MAKNDEWILDKMRFQLQKEIAARLDIFLIKIRISVKYSNFSNKRIHIRPQIIRHANLIKRKVPNNKSKSKGISNKQESEF